MVTETGLHVEITADVSTFDARLKAAQASLGRLEGTTRDFNNSLYAVSGYSAKAQGELRKLVTGAQSTNSALNQASASVIRYGANTGKATQNTANLTAQINDIGVMLQAGQSPFMLAIQQGTQMNQVLDNMGTTGKARVDALKQAIFNAISPANLLTVGIIGLGAAAVQIAVKMFSAKEETDNFRLTLKEAREEIAKMQEELRLLQLNRTPVEDALIAAVEEANTYYEDQLAVLGKMLLQQQAGVQIADEIILQQKAIVDEAERRLRLEEKALEEARKLPGAIQDQEAEMERLEEEARATREAFDAYEEALAAAIDEAFLLRELTKQTATSAEAYAAALAKTGQVNPFAEGEAGADPAKKGKGKTTGISVEENIKAATGGASAADKLATDLQALQDSLKSAEELQIEAFNRQQALLEEALAKKKLTEEEYFMWRERAQGEHQAAMTQIDAYAYGNNVDKLAAFMGDAASVLAEGNEDMLKISRAFAAAQALISTLQGAAKELEKGTFGFATAAAVIAKGMSFITAINGVTAGSASAGTAAAADTTGTTSAGTAAATTSAQVAIQLSGGDMFSRDQVILLINSINEAVEDGAELRLV